MGNVKYKDSIIPSGSIFWLVILPTKRVGLPNEKGHINMELKRLTGEIPPKVFEQQTLDLIKKSKSFGLDESSIKRVNEMWYMRNLEILSQDGMKLSIMPE